MAHFAHGGEHHRVIVIQFIHRRHPVAGEELCQPVRGIEFLLEQERGALVRRRLVPARPLDVAQLAHLLVGCPFEARTQLTQLIPDLLRVVVVHRIAHPGRNLADDLPVGFQIPLRLDRLKEALEAAIGRGVNPFMLAPRGRRQDNIRHRRGFSHKDILDNHQLEIVKRLTHRRQFSIGLERIFAHDVRRAHLFVGHAVRQLADTVAGMRRQALDAPGSGEFLAVFRELNKLVSRVGVR